MLHTHLAGRRTSRLGLGCGRLVGGAETRASRALVEAALALGIRHFDVAPSYGLGLAENVLGEALAGVGDATVVTKAGIGRPANAGAKALLIGFVRPLLAATPGLKARLARRAGGAARGQFAPGQVEASLADSLSRLKRETVDALLLHQPSPADLTPDLAATMERIVADGRARAVGTGTNDAAEALVPFGTVSQMRVDVAQPAPTSVGDLILHGALRRYPAPERLSPPQVEAMRALGRDPADPAAWPGLMLTLALANAPGSILLISARTPARLREAVAAVDWTLADAADSAALAQLRRLAVGSESAGAS
ncbi:aldo/keto reductase [Sphingomonas jatrophae]|uniref:Predicted oxidoreductase n=1 Tax=Sphingomonas jatrophae TaxID=1166337 RepID=A0A1I6M5F5_9SPHN|nr:aldo/keto reductase [Sphingomonas jatrophae]SFS10934.1 Predicted oxidoreductase [Sphingomonas jatrophae]